MYNPLPERFRKPVGNLCFMVLVYLANVGLFAIIDGKAKAPLSFVLIGFVGGSLLAFFKPRNAERVTDPEAR